jgi:uncharacterized short protein YbdD (DUF466 family)
VSSKTGNGFEELLGKLPALVKEYKEIYVPEMKTKNPDEVKKEEERIKKDLEKVGLDLIQEKLEDDEGM